MINSRSNHNHFFINVDKPKGLSSFDVVRHVKRSLPKEFKVGHMGTLDPFATGVLLVAANGATRLMDIFHQYLPKTYYAVGKLGVKTVTGDLTVEPIEHRLVNMDHSLPLDLELLQKKMKAQFVGVDYLQAPPAYSAAKFQGKALYKWAREGEMIQKPEKKREIFDLEILSLVGDLLTFRATVGGGTYIRVLFEDMVSLVLENIGALQDLRREAIGSIDLSNSLGDMEILGHRNDGWDWRPYAIPIEEAFPLPHLLLDDLGYNYYRCGKKLDINDCQVIDITKNCLISNHFWAYHNQNDNKKLLGLVCIDENQIKIIFNFPA